MTLEMVTTLWLIDECQPISQQQLADQLLLEKSAMKRAIDNLLKRDLIFVSHDPNNKKSKLLNTSEYGRDVALQGGSILEKIENDCLSVLSAQEQAQLLSITTKLINAQIDA